MQAVLSSCLIPLGVKALKKVWNWVRVLRLVWSLGVSGVLILWLTWVRVLVQAATEGCLWAGADGVTTV